MCDAIECITIDRFGIPGHIFEAANFGHGIYYFPYKGLVFAEALAAFLAQYDGLVVNAMVSERMTVRGIVGTDGFIVATS